MWAVRAVLGLLVALGLSACDPKFRTYVGPEVTSVQIDKSDRKMYILNGNQALAVYDIALGFAPVGPKHFEGDGKTPEGLYYITHKNPNSSYHLSLGISYPNTADRAYASAAGQATGGDIFIHGGPRYRTTLADWTAGCISVTDLEMEAVYAMVAPGTPIYILP